MSRPGVIVDLDGTMLDTNYLHVVAWARALRKHGYDGVEMTTIHAAIGIASDGLVEYVTGGTDDAVGETHGNEYETFQDDVRAFPRAADLLRECDGRGLAVVIATSGRKSDLDWMLPAIGVDESVLAAAATSGDVEEAKPAPDLMEVAMKAGDLDPERTVALGDTVWDVQAATKAGIPCVAVLGGGVGEAALRDAGAAEVWKNPADLLEHLDDSLLGRIGG
ncbi:HAD family hydrolase [Mobilicoccus pelagius]|uniref:Putative hydrolase n=1 Tax=Mobilicoccus pelagius NBRC 104925 TaxID=1089455 RepID=H5UR53_9MICO|nr:HAD family hydrolase [Mobilicoccus pelagius]GAB48211.1 putative hydrolase [Mobilicoccus pelagius NBRC 104925]